MFATLVVIVTVVILYENTTLTYVVQAVQHISVGVFVVASGPAEFLVIGLYIAWQVGVEYVAYVRFVNAHSKGYGSNHNNSRFGHKGNLIGMPLGAFLASVIGKSSDTICLE